MHKKQCLNVHVPKNVSLIYVFIIITNTMVQNHKTQNINKVQY